MSSGESPGVAEPSGARLHLGPKLSSLPRSLRNLRRGKSSKQALVNFQLQYTTVAAGSSTADTAPTAATAPAPEGTTGVVAASGASSPPSLAAPSSAAVRQPPPSDSEWRVVPGVVADASLDLAKYLDSRETAPDSAELTWPMSRTYWTSADGASSSCRASSYALKVFVVRLAPESRGTGLRPFLGESALPRPQSGGLVLPTLELDSPAPQGTPRSHSRSRSRSRSRRRLPSRTGSARSDVTTASLPPLETEYPAAEVEAGVVEEEAVVAEEAAPSRPGLTDAEMDRIIYATVGTAVAAHEVAAVAGRGADVCTREPEALVAAARSSSEVAGAGGPSGGDSQDADAAAAAAVAPAAAAAPLRVSPNAMLRALQQASQQLPLPPGHAAPLHPAAIAAAEAVAAMTAAAAVASGKFNSAGRMRSGPNPARSLVPSSMPTITIRSAGCPLESPFKNGPGAPEEAAAAAATNVRDGRVAFLGPDAVQADVMGDSLEFDVEIAPRDHPIVGSLELSSGNRMRPEDVGAAAAAEALFAARQGAATPVVLPVLGRCGSGSLGQRRGRAAAAAAAAAAPYSPHNSGSVSAPSNSVGWLVGAQEAVRGVGSGVGSDGSGSGAGGPDDAGISMFSDLAAPPAGPYSAGAGGVGVGVSGRRDAVVLRGGPQALPQGQVDMVAHGTGAPYPAPSSGLAIKPSGEITGVLDLFPQPAVDLGPTPPLSSLPPSPRHPLLPPHAASVYDLYDTITPHRSAAVAAAATVTSTSEAPPLSPPLPLPLPSSPSGDVGVAVGPAMALSGFEVMRAVLSGDPEAISRAAAAKLEAEAEAMIWAHSMLRPLTFLEPVPEGSEIKEGSGPLPVAFFSPLPSPTGADADGGGATDFFSAPGFTYAAAGLLEPEPPGISPKRAETRDSEAFLDQPARLQRQQQQQQQWWRAWHQPLEDAAVPTSTSPLGDAAGRAVQRGGPAATATGAASATAEATEAAGAGADAADAAQLLRCTLLPAAVNHTDHWVAAPRAVPVRDMAVLRAQYAVAAAEKDYEAEAEEDGEGEGVEKRLEATAATPPSAAAVGCSTPDADGEGDTAAKAASSHGSEKAAEAELNELLAMIPGSDNGGSDSDGGSGKVGSREAGGQQPITLTTARTELAAAERGRGTTAAATAAGINDAGGGGSIVDVTGRGGGDGDGDAAEGGLGAVAGVPWSILAGEGRLELLSEMRSSGSAAGGGGGGNGEPPLPGSSDMDPVASVITDPRVANALSYLPGITHGDVYNGASHRAMASFAAGSGSESSNASSADPGPTQDPDPAPYNLRHRAASPPLSGSLPLLDPEAGPQLGTLAMYAAAPAADADAAVAAAGLPYMALSGAVRMMMPSSGQSPSDLDLEALLRRSRRASSSEVLPGRFLSAGGMQLAEAVAGAAPAPESPGRAAAAIRSAPAGFRSCHHLGGGGGTVVRPAGSAATGFGFVGGMEAPAAPPGSLTALSPASASVLAAAMLRSGEEDIVAPRGVGAGTSAAAGTRAQRRWGRRRLRPALREGWPGWWPLAQLEQALVMVAASTVCTATELLEEACPPLAPCAPGHIPIYPRADCHYQLLLLLLNPH
ncbi:hypothetical protein VOLCADRAFT_94823 [Volvox carteri f. nagariensis]|uniref:Uncharacterized protein n=1 Tax=Volvox carteri f. nagariensis TaxID=3068 RepID=D8U5V2_VOLCA|nr:uncharacterized protein VOLCADRAFT_94823 [Volvox carteri f. nagariensis]EFJ44821.1 hypothetical protein VOLCADRAFT_94823 [Volvox carteri f. nagariensis]|eukprot:XP_002954104.1 hypothetical protein VOLCADRAFT_94823 [Volvox carteri f. nagariensis]